MILSLALFWYAAVPMAGTFIVRHGWRVFRRRFDELRLKPILDYRASRGDKEGEYRFAGSFESLSEDHILWIRNDDLTIPVDLRGAGVYLLPDDPGEGFPEKIKWEKISSLTGEARIYTGGFFVTRGKRRIFSSVPGKPLQVILYEGSDRTLTSRTVRGGRHKNKYLNFITPYALVLGAFSQIMTAAYFFNRPARRSAMISAFIALFAPLIPLFPPGILFAFIYRRLWWRARFCRACRDLARLPHLHFSGNQQPRPEGTGHVVLARYLSSNLWFAGLIPFNRLKRQGIKPLAYNEKYARLPDGSVYGARRYDTLPSDFFEREFSFIIPAEEKKPADKWYVFGILDEENADAFPSPPDDPFAVYGAFPGDPEILSRRYARKAWVLEIGAWLVFAASLILNLFFIRTLIMMTDLLSF